MSKKKKEIFSSTLMNFKINNQNQQIDSLKSSSNNESSLSLENSRLNLKVDQDSMKLNQQSNYKKDEMGF